jgi:hypothetical protein
MARNKSAQCATTTITGDPEVDALILQIRMWQASPEGRAQRERARALNRDWKANNDDFGGQTMVSKDPSAGSHSAPAVNSQRPSRSSIKGQGFAAAANASLFVAAL